MDLRQARLLARSLLREHGLDDWHVTIDRAKTRAGVCRFYRREIGLSGPMTLLHSEAEVRETILHEIAHALVGPRHGHDEVWRARARAIGSTGERCVAPDAPRPVGEWLGVCPAGHEVRRHRAPRRVQSCSRCSARFDVAHLLGWTFRGRRVSMPPGYAAELARVRERAGATAPLTAAPGRALGEAPAPDDGPVPQLGARVRITAPGRYEGAVGIVEGCGRTRFQVRVDDGILLVPVTYVVAA